MGGRADAERLGQQLRDTAPLTSICALILSKHPELTPFQLKSVLYLTANNVGGGT